MEYGFFSRPVILASILLADNKHFDYNKEYLSFPLTDIADSLYFAVDSDTAHDSAADPISLGVTWEEQ